MKLTRSQKHKLRALAGKPVRKAVKKVAEAIRGLKSQGEDCD